MTVNHKFRYAIVLAIMLFLVMVTYSINTGVTSETRSFEVVPMQHLSIPLPGNWSLISTPYELVNSSTKSVVNSISNRSWNLSTYIGGQWDQAFSDLPEGSWDLRNIERTYGYYIKLNESSTLEINGIYINKTNISLKQGWNMIGYPLNTSKNLSTALSSIAGNWTMLFALYNNTWTIEDPKTPPLIFEIKNLTPGRGYWINISTDTSLIIRD